MLPPAAGRTLVGKNGRQYNRLCGNLPRRSTPVAATGAATGGRRGSGVRPERGQRQLAGRNFDGIVVVSSESLIASGSSPAGAATLA